MSQKIKKIQSSQEGNFKVKTDIKYYVMQGSSYEDLATRQCQQVLCIYKYNILYIKLAKNFV